MCITSTLPSELMVTRPFAPEIQPAANAPAEGTMLKVVLCANALMLIKLSTRPVRNERLFFTVVFSFFICVVRMAALCHALHLVTRGQRPALIWLGGCSPLLPTPAQKTRLVTASLQDRAVALRIAHRSTPGACDELKGAVTAQSA